MTSKKLFLLFSVVVIFSLILFGNRLIKRVDTSFLFTNSEDQIVVDPDSGQKVLKDELTILTSGHDINQLIAPYNGSIRNQVKETSSYQVKFPISDLKQLKDIKASIEESGASVMLSIVLHPNNDQ